MARRAGSIAVVIAGIAMCAITGAVTVSGSGSDYAGLEATVRILTVAIPIAVGIYAIRRPPFERFGELLVAAGAMWFLTTLAGSGDATLYSIGRVAQWLFEPLLIYLLLAFPSGHLEHRFDRQLVWAAVGLVVVLYLPTALLVERYPVPSPVTSCGAGCPPNAFMVSSSEPAVIEDVVRPLREFLTILLFAIAAVRLGQRIRGGTRLMRRALGPVLAVACFRCAAFGALLLARRIAPHSPVTDALMWALAIAVPLTAVAFLAGIVRWWVFTSRSSQRLMRNLGGHPTPEQLRTALSDAFDDPSLTIAYWIEDGEGRWGDALGLPLAPPAPGPRRAVTRVVDGDRLVAAILHDQALEDDAVFAATATSYAVMALDHQRLSAQASALLRSVEESRARIQTAADDERRRIERDLHDGAQQRLVALRIKLDLAAERTGNGDGEDAERAKALRRLGEDVDEALNAVRSLAHGIYPAPLAERGLVAGLRGAALGTALPTTLVAPSLGRYPREIETAAYFCCLEALQNAAKHASGASGAAIEVWEDDRLRLEVRDDGCGFDPDEVTSGVGFTSMRDRLAAVGGELTITSSPGDGTCVAASIPVRAPLRAR